MDECFMKRFNDNEANMLWMLDDSQYWRNKMKAETSEIKWIKICKDGCSKDNIYTPNVDEVRWCSMCARWFHDGCCEELDLYADETRKWLRNNNQDYLLVDWAKVDAEHPSIEAIVGLPIARHPAEPAAPESLEKVIILAREKVIFAEEELDLIDYHDFIMEADANRWPDKVEEIVQVFLEEAIEEQPIFYLCPRCNNYAI
ncbi:uncharacterized protein STEHIDRAFT_109337 [Stereum hirsutum FP-91666 SS1]|uniref:uncharacterized protein n=1 Tax=Stereum hirsutum (strain FP-91666) TaxID=721885 RepID=UPI000440DE5A|nr:uncharacterized protein STEHIDRAFT_109337 [Stereum hirsutum FP-91666 SS1]EIM89055.1 hypothetical protein STEHIDRAFT_109337 [Stereum hirsutum FP-91666 SS1]